MIKIVLFDSKPYDEESFKKYNSKKYKITFLSTNLNEKTVILAKGYDVVVPFVNDNLNKYVVDKLYEFNVKLIALRSAGYNNVDLKACKNKISVVHVPSYSPEAVAEFAMALFLTSIRRVHKAYNRVREYNFSINGLTGITLHNKTIGIIGTGKIGRIFASICKGFNMNIVAYDPFPNSNLDLKYVSLDELYSASDFISLHCPLTNENKYLINKDSIGKMKKGVVIINTSRGELINSKDLLDGIKKRKIGAVCLDVYDEEGDVFFEDKSNHILNDDILARLISMPNVIVTSHQAFLTEEALNNIAETTIKNIKSFFEDKVIFNEIKF